VLKEPSATVVFASRVENVIHDKISASNGSQTKANAVIDRCELLDHENSNLRQLLASVSSILNDLTHSVAGSEGHQNTSVSAEEITELPVTWVYERVKNEIESSLNILSDHILS